MAFVRLALGQKNMNTIEDTSPKVTALGDTLRWRVASFLEGQASWKDTWQPDQSATVEREVGPVPTTVAEFWNSASGLRPRYAMSIFWFGSRMGNERLFYNSEQWRVNVVIYFHWFGSTTVVTMVRPEDGWPKRWREDVEIQRKVSIRAGGSDDDDFLQRADTNSESSFIKPAQSTLTRSRGAPPDQYSSSNQVLRLRFYKGRKLTKRSNISHGQLVFRELAPKETQATQVWIGGKSDDYYGEAWSADQPGGARRRPIVVLQKLANRLRLSGRARDPILAGGSGI